ncbi:MAG TPA: translation elongation factor Ts [Saprospiraceae bacterium]|nr:elongation factor Ts [Lewinellaceae bacterium]HPG05970.1 translation elongation factor Ts [Saprospiraceae bacterium]HPR01019.1 translation elongation factor Ts [Saprospiraceae bacterium]HQU51886.1 translation elongation factor Ts [Saprospiraceae bacterium]HRV83498.1 translation elongation factor Ts [Saprospiraceae bacterium]
MSAISATDVKKLRDITGAGMMDCKKALAEADGDFDKAIEVLRKQGQKLSLKRADREATEGVVIAKVSDDSTRGVVVKLSSETDFVAKNESFIDLTKEFADIALENFPATLEDLLALPYKGGITIQDKVTEQVGVIGEKIELAEYARLEAPLVTSYIHMGNKAAVLIGLNQANPDFIDAGRDVAMQVAAMKPLAVDKDGVDATIVEKEIEIGKEQARQEGKPEEMLEKIALGKLSKFYKENTLLNQEFVKEAKTSVAQYLERIGKGLTVTEFKHIQLG